MLVLVLKTNKETYIIAKSDNRQALMAHMRDIRHEIDTSLLIKALSDVNPKDCSLFISTLGEQKKATNLLPKDEAHE